MLYLTIAAIAEIVAVLLDFIIPPGYAEWLLYILPLLIVLRANRQKFLFLIAGFASLLLIARTFLYPLEIGNAPIDVGRRVAGLVALWTIVLVLSDRIKAYSVANNASELNESVFKNMTDGLVLAHQNGEIIRINPAAAQIAGLLSEREGLKAISNLYTEWMLFDTDGQQLPVEQWPFTRSLRGERFEKMTCKVHRIGDSREWYGSFSGAPVMADSGKLLVSVTTFRDITDIMAAYENLRILNKELKIANHDLEAFSYSVSHDLRSPLNAIKGLSSIVEEDSWQCLSNESREYLKQIENSVSVMQHLINDLLTFSRAGHQEMKRQKVNLSDIAQSITEELRRIEPDRQVTVQIQEELLDDVDPDLMKIALNNLLSNAWKFTKNRQKALIAFGSRIIDGRTVYIVKDNGAGFNMKYADKLFKPFQRLHSESIFKGTGIGLSIVHRIITRHGGKIWAESEPDTGSSFFFTLQ